MSTFLIAIGALFFLDVLVHIFVSKLALPMFECKPPLHAEELPPHPDSELIEFPTTNGLILRGSLWRQENHGPRGLIVFCHEFDGNQGTARFYCQGLHEAGFDILAFDFRNQGDSDFQSDYEPLHWVTEFEVSDVLAAFDYVADRSELNQLPLGVFGVSRGGGAALAAAARSPQVELVITEAAYSTISMVLSHCRRWLSLLTSKWISKMIPNWHIRMTVACIKLRSQRKRNCRYTNLESLLPRLRDRDVLMISGKSDNYSTPMVTRNLFQKIGGDQCEMWFVDGAKHNMARHVAQDEYDARLIKFCSAGTEVELPQTQESLIFSS